MRILLDECVPWPIRKLLSAHQCITAQQQGWGGIRNGELLRLAENAFDLFITSDQSMAYQQNLTGRRIAILQLSTNKLRQINAGAVLFQAVVAEMKPGEFRVLRLP